MWKHAAYMLEVHACSSSNTNNKNQEWRIGRIKEDEQKIEFDIRNNFDWMCLFVYVFARSNRLKQRLEEYEDK